MENANINSYIDSKIISGDNILKVLKSFQETEWSRCSPVFKEVKFYEDREKEPHCTAWRWKNPDPELDKLIVEAVESFEGQIEWEIRSRDRRPSLGGTNWIIEPTRKREFFDRYKDLYLGEIDRRMTEEKPEIGILSNQDVPKLAEHIKRYVEENRQSANDSQATDIEFAQPRTIEDDLSNFKPYIYPPKPDHIIPTGIEGLLTVYFAKDYDELVEQYGKMRLITNVVAKYKEDQHSAYVKDCLNEVSSLVAQECDEKYLRDKIVNEYGVKIPISKLGGSYQIFLERLHEELLGKRIYS